jgi:hypothetical protein
MLVNDFPLKKSKWFDQTFVEFLKEPFVEFFHINMTSGDCANHDDCSAEFMNYFGS